MTSIYKIWFVDRLFVSSDNGTIDDASHSVEYAKMCSSFNRFVSSLIFDCKKKLKNDKVPFNQKRKRCFDWIFLRLSCPSFYQKDLYAIRMLFPRESQFRLYWPRARFCCALLSFVSLFQWYLLDEARNDLQQTISDAISFVILFEQQFWTFLLRKMVDNTNRLNIYRTNELNSINEIKIMKSRN